MQRCFELFSVLASSGIPIHLFLSRSYLQEHDTYIKQHRNVVVDFIELEELQTFQDLSRVSLDLPSVKTDHHDTRNFMILMHSKIEFIHRVMQAGIYSTPHFAWIDFSICHVFQNPEATLKYLKMLAITDLQPNLLVFPGCWEKGFYKEFYFETVNWRFCGGFFLGDIASLELFHGLYRALFRAVLHEKGKLTWEVNFWAYLEEYCGWEPQWYPASHDDTIVKIPGSSYKTVASLTTIPSRIGTTCRLAIDSLIDQVDRIYVSVAKSYPRFPQGLTVPDYFQQEPYKSKVELVWMPDDLGPASKYLGALGRISKGTWIFFCDDDQEYSHLMLRDLTREAREVAVYQNFLQVIRILTSGGLIHGFVGNFIHASLLQDLKTFPLPESARFVDDQWMSIYCHKKQIPILTTNLEFFEHIFRVLQDGHEKWSVDSLAELGNRDAKVAELAEFFKVKFEAEGRIVDV